jgi:hypothetical protein
VQRVGSRKRKFNAAPTEREGSFRGQKPRHHGESDERVLVVHSKKLAEDDNAMANNYEK